ncbi:MAG: hypothetical protein Ta2F_13110 [Termitinemataceae bacterium]|nr:MAG: hypothetical protein Ta2F_13110 [Termitinemataceae bacterium]
MGKWRNVFFGGMISIMLVFGLMFIGCNDENNQDGNNQDGNQDEDNPKYTLVPDASTLPSIAQKFGITDATKDGVETTFSALHELISAPNSGDDFTQVIKLGDYIDLPSLTVAGDAGHLADPDYGYINVTSALRLIVIGINSFNGKNGNNTSHVVFHFQNIPGTHKMNTADDNTTGYLTSAMRSYITGNFLTGLKNAGVPDGFLWAPSRRVASNGGSSAEAQTITDKLWLPTAWEMTGEQSYSVACESSSNQASFVGFYKNDAARKKTGNDTSYWLASPNYSTINATHFCRIGVYGEPVSINASALLGCVPAFCVR